ncbi:solute carrier family 15 member 4 [Lingula anatina]|uniref:Solute carrier family 15 member 4 n=1 Tax=Lingula anatina TaxID=7574 RepID=A0A1S3I6H8_LINAN|nr:solute carrier family 15 member 4 [Lingula anatina]|eukprot:XP_013393451.1 solute carrier family 15 member 4 [Lingula anatina]
MCILMTKMFTKWAFCLLVQNMFSYCNVMLDKTMAEAYEVKLIFSAGTLVICLIGGLIADTVLGMFFTGTLSFVWQLVGLLFILGSTFTENTADAHPRTDLYMVGLGCTAIAYSGLNAILVVYGAEQLRKDSHRQSYIHWNYFFNNFGALLGVPVTTSLAVVEFSTNTHYYFVACFTTAVIVTALALLAFTAGFRHYKDTTIRGKKILHAVKAALSSTPGCCRTVRSILTSPAGSRYSTSVPHNNDDTKLDTALLQTYDRLTARGILRVLLISSAFLGFAVYYYGLIDSALVLQSEGMKMYNFTLYHVPDDASKLEAFNLAGVCLLIPIMDLILYPYLRKRGSKVPCDARILTGMAIGSLAAIYSIVLEGQRKEICELNDGEPTLSWFYITPSITFLTVAEAFAFVAAYEYCYLQGPTGLRCVSVGLLDTATGLSSFIAIGIRKLVQDKQRSWFPDKHATKVCELGNKSRLENFFLIQLGILLLSAVSYLCVISSIEKLQNITRVFVKKRPEKSVFGSVNTSENDEELMESSYEEIRNSRHLSGDNSSEMFESWETYDTLDISQAGPGDANAQSSLSSSMSSAVLYVQPSEQASAPCRTKKKKRTSKKHLPCTSDDTKSSLSASVSVHVNDEMKSNRLSYDTIDTML